MHQGRNKTKNKRGSSKEFKLRFFCKRIGSMWYRMSDKAIILVFGNGVNSSDKP